HLRSEHRGDLVGKKRVGRARRGASRLIVEQTGAPLDQCVECRFGRERTVRAITGNRQLNDTWVERADRVETEPERCRNVRTPVLDIEICIAQQRLELGEVVRRLQIKADASLATIRVRPYRTDAFPAVAEIAV